VPHPAEFSNLGLLAALGTKPGEIYRLAGVALVAATVLWGCATGKPTPVPEPATQPLVAVPDGEWPALRDDLDTASLVEACGHGLSYLDGLPSDRLFRFGPEERTAGELAAGLRRVVEIINGTEDLRDRGEALRAEFILLRSSGRDGKGEVLITGYYEPLLDARRNLQLPYEHPVYGVPDDLVTIDLTEFGVEADRSSLIGRVDGRHLVPYPERGVIDYGTGLPGEAEVLGYLDDQVKVFFLQVQGSGTLVFPDGERVRAGYSSGNGRPYRSVGRLLLDEEVMTVDEMSMQGIQTYLGEHPEEIERVLSHNPSYVFFRELPAEGGPLGCFGVPVTAGRSIATDRKLFPAPTVAYLAGRLPTGDGEDRPFARLVVVEDTGGAITGPGRVDLFFGAGPAAGDLAGRTKHLGELYILLPRR